MKDLGAEVVYAEATQAESVAAHAFVDLFKQARESKEAIRSAKELARRRKEEFQEALKAIESQPKNESEAKIASLSIELRELQTTLEDETKECKANTERAEAAFREAVESGHDGTAEAVIRKHNIIVRAWQDLEEARTDYKLRIGAVKDAMREAKAKTVEVMTKKAKQLSLF